MAITSNPGLQKRKKTKKSKNIVKFEAEIISKDKASKILSDKESEIGQLEINDSKENRKRKREIEVAQLESQNNVISQTRGKRNKKKKEKATDRIDNSPEHETIIDDLEDIPNKKQKRTKKKKSEKIINTENLSESNDSSSAQGTIKKGKKNELDKTALNKEGHEEISSDVQGKTEQSKRAKKREKHNKLLEEKKTKTETATQENVLNYLSKWKHSREQWKFEKLKQIWLSENLFDSAKVPADFWQITIDYFSESKGFIRKVLLREAIKIVDADVTTEDENAEDDFQSKLKRARYIVQILQE